MSKQQGDSVPEGSRVAAWIPPKPEEIRAARGDMALMASKDDVRAEIARMEEQLGEVLPSRIDLDRFLRVCASVVMKTPALMECTKVSLLTAIGEAAQLGLEPSGLLGSAYLVPYNRKEEIKVTSPDGKRTATVDVWVKEAKLIPGYRGLIDLARRSGGIRAIWANIVREKDGFRLAQGTAPGIIHEPFIPSPKDTPEDRDPGPMIGAYMVAVLDSGEQQVEWMTADQIDAVRRRSKAATSGPWVTDPDEMSRKTVVRRGAKYLPLSTEFRRALELDEEAERFASEAPSGSTASGARAAALGSLARRAGMGVRTAQAREESTDTDADPGPAPGSTVAPSGAKDEVVRDATPEEVDRANEAGLADGETTVIADLTKAIVDGVICQAPNTGGDGEILGHCVRETGHKELSHKDEDGNVWPVSRG